MLASHEYDRQRPAYSPEVALWVQEQCPGGRTELVLDIGCGTGRSSRWARQYADRVVGIDASSQMIEIAEQVNYDPCIEFHQASAEYFAHFDYRPSLILCGSAFEWFDKELFRREAHKVLTSDGSVVIIWSWIETLDEASSKWYSLMRRLLGAQVGPDPNDAMAMAWTFFPAAPACTVNRTRARYSPQHLVEFVKSSSYWRRQVRPDRNSALSHAIAEFASTHGGADGRVSLQFREVVMMGRPW